MIRIVLYIIFFSSFFPATGFASGETENPTYETIAAMACADFQNPITQAKFKDMEIKDFANWYLTGLEAKYPAKDVPSIKHRVLTHKPNPRRTDDRNPFVFMLAMACTDGESVKDGAVGENLEKTLLFILKDRAEYFEMNRNKGR